MKKFSDVSKGSGEPNFLFPVSANRRHVESQFVRGPPLNDFVFLGLPRPIQLLLLHGFSPPATKSVRF